MRLAIQCTYHLDARRIFSGAFYFFMQNRLEGYSVFSFFYFFHMEINVKICSMLKNQKSAFFM